MKNEHNMYDDEAVELLHEKEKVQAANLLFQLTKLALIKKKIIADSGAENEKDHESKFMWAYCQLLAMDIIHLTDVLYQEEVVDEEGDIIGYKGLKEERGEFTDDQV